MANIKVSEKHGVNPCIPICCWCGEDKNEIALLGKLKGDVEAPMHMILDYEPCDECKKQFNSGVVIIEVTSTQPEDGRPPISNTNNALIYPTFRYCVVVTKTANQIFSDPKLHDGSILLLDESMFSQLIKGDAENV